MQRAFGIDVPACPRCGDRLVLVALIEDSRVVRRILGHLGLATAPGGATGPGTAAAAAAL